MDALNSFLRAIDDTGGKRPMEGPRRLVPGAVIGRTYRLRAKIAHGGMASIWEADDEDLGRVVAIKFLSEKLSNDDIVRKRFDLEAKAAARLRTPFAVQIYAHGTDNDTPYIVMERLYGEDLQERLDRLGRLSILAVGKIVDEAARALADAHSLGIVHRDLKPRNLFLARHDGGETLKLVDFGVAKHTTRAEVMTRTATMLGSPAYMSPEQIRGDRTIDARTDLWSLGVIIYRALTGEKPFEGDMTTVIDRIVSTRPRNPSEVCPALSPHVDRFLEKALAPDRADRFADAAELRRAFEAVVREALADCPTIALHLDLSERRSRAGSGELPPRLSRSGLRLGPQPSRCSARIKVPSTPAARAEDTVYKVPLRRDWAGLLLTLFVTSFVGFALIWSLH